MDLKDAERFVQVAQEDYDRRVSVYLRLVEGDPHEAATEDLREARADVLAAQQVLELARREARGAGRRDVEEEVACPNCGRMVGRAYLFDSAARGEEWCAGCDVGGAQETGR